MLDVDDSSSLQIVLDGGRWLISAVLRFIKMNRMNFCNGRVMTTAKHHRHCS